MHGWNSLNNDMAGGGRPTGATGMVADEEI